MNLSPWKKKTSSAGNSGSLAHLQDFPAMLQRMRNDFDQLFSEFAHGWPELSKTFGNGWHWGMDIDDKEDSVVLRAEAPGFEPDDFDIRISGDRLTLRASHKKESKEKGHEYQEQSECYESVSLPPGIDASKVDAKYHNGILTLTIPKTKEGRGQKISVKNG